jgi:hypothetical protein
MSRYAKGAWMAGIVFAVLILTTLGVAFHASGAPQNSRPIPPGLDLKAGFWDFSLHSSRIVPPKNLDTPELEKQLETLSPADRKKGIDQAQATFDQIRSQSAKGTDTHFQGCLKASDIAANKIAALSDPPNCKRTDSISPQRESLHWSCPVQKSASYLSEQTWTLERIDAEHFKLTTQVAVAGDDAVTLNSVYVAKWVRESCAAPPTDKQIEQAKRLAEAPISAQNVRQGNDYIAHIANKTGKVITAYSYDFQEYGAGQVVDHIFDSATLVSAPLKPHGSTSEGMPGIVVEVEPEAAIFSDGTTWGTDKRIATMMSRRVTRLAALKAIASSLCDSLHKGLAPEAAATALEARKTSAPGQPTQMLNEVQRKTYEEIVNYMRVAHQGVKPSIPETLKAIQSDANLLAEDPVKDSNGNLFITRADAQIPCAAGR